MFHGFIFTRTNKSLITLSIIVSYESVAQIEKLYQSSSNRDGQNSDTTSFRSMRDQRKTLRHDGNRHRAAVCGHRISPVRHLQHLGTIRQQSEHGKKARFRISDETEQLEVK